MQGPARSSAEKHSECALDSSSEFSHDPRRRYGEERANPERPNAFPTQPNAR